jgi:hypothetical protein
VRIHAGSQEGAQGGIDAVTRGVDDSGALRVERADGSTIAVHLADSVVWLEA